MTSGATPSFGQTARGVSEQQGGGEWCHWVGAQAPPPGLERHKQQSRYRASARGVCLGGGAFCIVATVSAPNRVVGTELECQSSAAYSISATHSTLTSVGVFLCERIQY